MILKLAFRNIVGNGWRSLINIFIIALVMVGMIWMQAMYYSWVRIAITQQKDWEFGSGMLRVTSFDPFDAFSWDNSYARVPSDMNDAIAADKAVPILFSPGVIYPQGRMMPAMVKGISTDQNLLRIPTDKLKDSDSGFPAAVIGKSMAKSTRLNEGDVVTLRVKDIDGAFNTLDLEIVDVMNTPVPSVDAGIIWMDLEKLRELKRLPDMASVLVVTDVALARPVHEGWREITEDEYFSDLYSILETEKGQQSIMFGLLLFLAMLAVFDTQALALFKRRKEIGTLAALGMTRAQIIALFTTEGVMYMLFAIVMGGVLGFPFLYYFAVKGYVLPMEYDEFGMIGFGEPIKFLYPASIVLGTLAFMFVLTAFVSWLPSRRIAKMNITDAIRGKVG